MQEIGRQSWANFDQKRLSGKLLDKPLFTYLPNLRTYLLYIPTYFTYLPIYFTYLPTYFTYLPTYLLTYPHTSIPTYIHITYLHTYLHTYLRHVSRLQAQYCDKRLNLGYFQRLILSKCDTIFLNQNLIRILEKNIKIQNFNVVSTFLTVLLSACD